MMRSMFSGVSGLKIHQAMMDVIGNNIANINTIGYKSSSVNFQSMLSQTIKGASTPNAESGGTNPVQVGLGAKMSSIDFNFVQGNLQSTGKITDMAIQGEGFFIVKSGIGTYYTRAGNFAFDSFGNLVNPSDGSIVQGWLADTQGVVNTNTTPTNLNVPINQTIQPNATTRISYAGNLPSDASIGNVFYAPIQVIDSQGNSHDLTVMFTKTDSNEWSWEVTTPSGASGDGVITFNSNGSIASVTGGPIEYSPVGADPMSITPDFGSIGKIDGITQFATNATVAAINQNGNVSGTLQSIAIGGNGEITGVFSNGQNKVLGQIAMALFKNPSGLLSVGNSFFAESNNSGVPIIGEPDSGGRGQIIVGTVEMSNVDLAKEFADMIVAQRGFQANSKIISASDEMLQVLVNMKK